jgi:cell surface glycoprotein 1
MKRRIFACLLALVMLVSVLPVALAADPVAKIRNDTYATLDEAIKNAQDKDVIELLADCELTSGIKLENKSLTIRGVGTTKPTITLKECGIHASSELGNPNKRYLTFVNCALDIRSKNVGGATANLITNTDLTFNNCNVTITNPKEESISAIYLYQESNLFIKNNSVVNVSGFTGNRCSGIYADDSEYENMPNRDIQVTDGSTLTITNCNWHGMTVDPIDMLIDDHSVIDISNCGNSQFGGGGLGCYFGKLTIKNGSALNTNDNRGLYWWGWGTFVKELEMDSTSTLSSCRNTGDGIDIGGKGIIPAGANVTLDENKGNGLVSYSDNKDWFGDVQISAGAKVSIRNNTRGIWVMQNAVLDINTSTVTNNGTELRYPNGGGICVNGTAKIGPAVALYNNHAYEYGDDIYNADGASITFADVGTDWVLDDCNHMIDGWYEDGLEGETLLRWNVHNTAAAKHVVKKDAGTYTDAIAYKAAHDEEYYEPGENPVADYILPALWLNTKDHYSYLIGYADGTVKPEGKITRAEVATIFFRLLTDDARAKFWMSTNNYTDVPADKWYNNAVSTLSNMGVISGYADGTFKPDAPISRAEFAKIAVSFSNVADLSYRGYFADVRESDWFSGFVAAAKDAGLIEGYNDGTFKPEKAITRAEVCTIVNRTLGRKPSASHMKISDRIDWPDVSVTDWYYEAIMEATNSHTYQMGQRVETWNDKLPQRDWALLETGWANAYTGNGGEVN